MRTGELITDLKHAAPYRQLAVIGELLRISSGHCPHKVGTVAMYVLRALCREKTLSLEVLRPLETIIDAVDVNDGYESHYVSGDSYDCLLVSSPRLDVFKFLIQLWHPDLYSLPIWTRLHVFTGIGRADRSWNPEALRLLVRPDGKISSEDVSAALRGGTSLLHHICWHYGRQIHPEDAWRVLLGDVIAASGEDNLHHLRPRSQGSSALTPLLSSLDGFQREDLPGRDIETMSARCKSMDRFMRIWLKDVQKCGIDLQIFGERESSALATGRISEGIWSVDFWDGIPWLPRERIVCTGWLKSIHYGRTPEDWHLEWDLMVEEFAGDFWGLDRRSCHRRSCAAHPRSVGG